MLLDAEKSRFAMLEKQLYELPERKTPLIARGPVDFHMIWTRVYDLAEITRGQLFDLASPSSLKRRAKETRVPGHSLTKQLLFRQKSVFALKHFMTPVCQDIALFTNPKAKYGEKQAL